MAHSHRYLRQRELIRFIPQSAKVGPDILDVFEMRRDRHQAIQLQVVRDLDEIYQLREIGLKNPGLRFLIFQFDLNQNIQWSGGELVQALGERNTVYGLDTGEQSDRFSGLVRLEMSDQMSLDFEQIEPMQQRNLFLSFLHPIFTNIAESVIDRFLHPFCTDSLRNTDEADGPWIPIHTEGCFPDAIQYTLIFFSESTHMIFPVPTIGNRHDAVVPVSVGTAIVDGIRPNFPPWRGLIAEESLYGRAVVTPSFRTPPTGTQVNFTYHI